MNYALRFAVALLLLANTAASRRHKSPGCGSSQKYWSSSCGAIGTATSRHCSEGGTLVNPDSCKHKSTSIKDFAMNQGEISSSISKIKANHRKQQRT